MSAAIVNRIVDTENLYRLSSKRKNYPPSLLVVGDDAFEVLSLKRRLENHGCRVCGADIDSLGLARICQKYFDVIVLHIKDLEGIFQACKKLEANPELASIPIVLLTAQECSETAINQLKMRPVYCLSQDSLAEAGLLQIIEQIRYMTDRYM